MRFRQSIIFLVVTVSFFLTSCSKQDASGVKDSIYTGSQEMSRLEACTRVNFAVKVLEHQNLIWMFDCLQWNKEFPEMYKSLKQTSAQSWNHVFLPIDQEFITNQTRRDRFFKQIKVLDSKGSLDDLGNVIVALNETNYFDSLNLMFQCADNPNQAECQKRKGRLITQDELKNILDILKLNPALVSNFSQILKNFNAIANSRQGQIRDEVRKFNNTDSFRSARIELLDGFADKALGGLNQDDREFISKFLMSKNRADDSNWVHSWLNSPDLTNEKFKNLLVYPLITNPELIQEVNAIKYFYNNGMVCTYKEDQKVNDVISFDFTNYTKNYVEVLKTKSFQDFFDFTATSLTGMKMASEACQQVSKNQFNVNFLVALNKLSKLLNEKKFYELFKYALWMTRGMTNEAKVTSKFENDQYLLNFLTTSLFQGMLNVNASVYKNNEAFYPLAFSIAKELDPKSYERLGRILLEVLRKDNDHIGQGIARFWNFYNFEEKNFLFRFVDRHFDQETNFVDLFEFYATLLDEYEAVQPVLFESYAKDDVKKEMSYMALAEITSHLDGAAIQGDFKRFFTRDHMLKILQILSSGMDIPRDAQERLEKRNTQHYYILADQNDYYYDVKPDYSQSPTHQELLECLDIVSKTEKGFYQLVLEYPEQCKKSAADTFSVKLFGWIHDVNADYKDVNSKNGNLFDNKGIVSPRMISGTLAVAKIIDETVGSNDQKGGLSYLMTSLKEHLYTNGLEALVLNGMTVFSEFMGEAGDQNEIYRNALIRLFTKEANFTASRSFFQDVSGLFDRYVTWVQNKELEKYNQAREDKIVYKKEFACESVMNTFIYTHSCPDKELVKKHLKNIFKLMTNIYEKPQKSGIHHLVKSMRADTGIKIPYQSANQKTHVVSLGETFRYLYDTTDRSMKVNNIETYYQNKDWKEKRISMTTLERVEIVIRDVKFKNNYLGAGFLNGIVRAPSYDDEVKYRKDLMEKCIKIPKVRCFRKMTDDEKRQADNALISFDSLLDVNNGRGLEPRLKYGAYLQAFEQTLVASSAWEAQEVKLLPLKDELLQFHNGRVLGEMTMINLWSNTGRLVRDRLGRKREDFERFMATDMKRVDDAILRGFDLNEAGDIGNRLIKKLINPDASGKIPMDQMIDWASGLNYDETRVAQEVLGRFLLLSSYLGSPKEVFGVESKNQRFNSYADNNLYEVLKMSEILVNNFQTLLNALPGNYRLVDALDVMNNALIFINAELKKSNNPEENIAYRVVNETFNILQALIFDEHSERAWYLAGDTKVKGLDLFTSFIIKPENVIKLYELTKANYDYISRLHDNNAESLRALSKELGKLVKKNELNFSSFQDYLSFTTNREVCLSANGDCEANSHYDELMKIVDYLLIKEGNQYKLQKMNQKIFVENFDQVNKLFDELIPAIKVYKQQPAFQ